MLAKHHGRACATPALLRLRSTEGERVAYREVEHVPGALCRRRGGVFVEVKPLQVPGYLMIVQAKTLECLRV